MAKIPKKDMNLYPLVVAPILAISILNYIIFN